MTTVVWQRCLKFANICRIFVEMSNIQSFNRGWGSEKIWNFWLWYLSKYLRNKVVCSEKLRLGSQNLSIFNFVPVTVNDHNIDIPKLCPWNRNFPITYLFADFIIWITLDAWMRISVILFLLRRKAFYDDVQWTDRWSNDFLIFLNQRH